jgi:hypothetical protein
MPYAPKWEQQERERERERIPPLEGPRYKIQESAYSQKRHVLNIVADTKFYSPSRDSHFIYFRNFCVI